MEIGVITNPNSRKNRNRPDRAQRLQRIVGTLGEVHETASVESIKPVLREFLRKRARYWVASAAGGVGQRFYSKYYSAKDPNPRTIVKVVANTVASMPIAMSPLSKLPLGNLSTYAREVFAPTLCKVTLDGMVLPGTAFT